MRARLALLAITLSRSLRSLAPITLVGCAFPHRDAELPRMDEAWIAVLSGEMPPPIDDVSRHAWIVGSIPGREGYSRWELHPFRSAPFDYLGSGDVAVHGIVRGDRATIEELARCLDRSTAGYPERHPTYWPIPGPNSNTIIAEALRECGIHIELPATCIGRDYLGPAGAAITESGTGVQLESWVAGVRVGLKEGVEAHFVSLPIGVHVWPPGITVPLNPAGRVGIDLDGHATSEQLGRTRSASGDDYDDLDSERRTRDREYGLGVAWMFLRGARVKRPDDAGGLAERVTAGLSGRAVFANRAGYAFGGDLELGAGFPLGFAYSIQLYPAGIAWMVGDTGMLAAFAGAGVSGVSARVPGALEIPIELRAELDVTRRARLGLRAVTTFIPAEGERRGASILPFGDELTLGTLLRLGPTRSRNGGDMIVGRGRFLSLERHEVMRTYWLGVTFGSEMDFGG